MDGIDVGMSSIVPKCFCLCDRDFIECSCPDIRTCSKCRSECLNREAPKSKKRALDKKDPCFKPLHNSLDNREVKIVRTVNVARVNDVTYYVSV